MFVMTLKTSNRRGRLMRYTPFILWVAIIFYFSSSQGSAGNTSRFIRPLLEFLFPQAGDETLQFYHFLIRKVAHLTAYGVGAVAAFRAYSRSSRDFVKGYPYICTIITIGIVATLDELNQGFNVLRTGSPYDILLDLTGCLLVLGVIFLYRSFALHRSSPQ